MFETGDAPRVYALAPGVDFPKVLVEGLVERMADRPPDAMARVTLYLNTSRMLRHVRAVLDDHGARFLPRLKLIGEIGRDPVAGLRPAVSALRRRLELAELVGALVARERDFAAGTATFDLADSLARLMDEMQAEGVAPEALDTDALAIDHARHWQRSLEFIRIVNRYFNTDDAPDPEARQRRVIESLVETWRRSPPPDPIIVAGSTGSRGTTALLMRAVAKLPQGAVILPGFDFDMPDAAWNSLEPGGMSAEDHPQFRFAHLLQTLGLRPADLKRWQDVDAPCPARNRLVSLALRPAPMTDQWMLEGPSLSDIPEAFENIALIEALTPRGEALAIALRLRKAVDDGVRAALITPDRVLTRRVAAALDRWRILPDDSAGQPLSQTAPGLFLRLVAAVLGQKLRFDTLLTLLKHPLTTTGAGMRGDHLRLTRDLELHLRRHGPAYPTGTDLMAWAGTDDVRKIWASWLTDALEGVANVGASDLSTLVETHVELSQTLAAGPGGSVEDSELWRERAGREARRVVEELRREARSGGVYGVLDYADLIGTLLRDATVRQSDETHPLIDIWGTLEARVQGADLVILAGLNEGVWPALPGPDPWLSRQMRKEVGLLLPERQIGLSAHDFQQAVASGTVVLSRALHDGEAETVASRWLSRITNLLNGLTDRDGPQALVGARQRGQYWLDLAGRLETPPQKVPAAVRPSPCPPVDARPRQLPVTGITRLIRDPYAVYARYVLRLAPLDPLRPEPDARIRGRAVHKVLERFIREQTGDESSDAAVLRLMSVAESVLEKEIPWPMARRIWLAKLGRVANEFIADEAVRRTAGRPVFIEESGSVGLVGVDFRLTARPDRIDRLNDGRIHIYDYKTGPPPSVQAQSRFEKQLLLEAAMAERGAFREIGASVVEGVSYIGVGSDPSTVMNPLENDVVGRTWEELHRLIQSLHDRGRGFTSRRAVMEERFSGDYDHLARFGEWDMSDPPVPENVG